MRSYRVIALILFSAAAVGLSRPTWAVADDAKTKAAQKFELRKKLKEAADAKRKAESAQPAKATQPVEAAKPVAPKPAVKLPAVLTPAALAKFIDQQIDARLKAESIPASERTTDAEFLRRVSLDLTGTIPTGDEAKAFLDSTASDKRERLVATLLASPNYGRHLADLWTTKLFPRDSDNRFVLKDPLRDWFAAEFNKNASWAEMTTKLLSTTGDVETNPEVTFFLANRTIDKLTDAVGTHFLGQSVACAQCHNHPFTTVKQTEYWELAGFFSKVVADRPRNVNKGGDNNKIGVKEGFGPSKAKDFFPEAAIKTSPKFLGEATPKFADREPYRPALAAWVAGPNNPYFAKAMANRTWALLFGRGLVEAVDDMKDSEDASHPELLDALALQFAANKFNLKDLYEAILLSEAYQRSSKPLPSNAKDDELYSHNRVKVMLPEQLYDSLQVLNATALAALPLAKGKGEPKAKPAPMRGGGNQRDQFVTFFLAGSETANQAEYEAGIPQALKLMNSKANLANFPNAFRAFFKPNVKPADAIEAMYLSVLSRRPTADESTRLLAYLDANGRDSAADILWALSNSSEFMLIR